MLTLTVTKRTDKRLLERMAVHYSQPKGFVGRSICYAVEYDGVYYGHIVAGSATLHLPGRNEFLGIDSQAQLNQVINNIFFNVQKVNDKYPTRNFTSMVVREFMTRAASDWLQKYGDQVLGFETLIELPRTGELYLRAGFVEVGITKGYTCRRVSGNETGKYTGERVWDRVNLKPKSVLCKKYS